MRDIHNKINFTSNNNYWVLQLSVFLPFAYLLKLFHSCEIKTVWTFPRGPKEVKEFSSVGFVAHPRWDIWPRVNLSLYSHAFTTHKVIQQQQYSRISTVQITIWSTKPYNSECHIDAENNLICLAHIQYITLQKNCFKAVLTKILMLMFIIF